MKVGVFIDSMMLCYWLVTEFVVFEVYLFPPNCPVPIFTYGDLVVFIGDDCFFFFYIENGLTGLGVIIYFLLSLTERFFSALFFSIFLAALPISMTSRLAERSTPFFLYSLLIMRGEQSLSSNSLPLIALSRFTF